MPTPRKPKGKSGKNALPSALDSEKRLLQERQRQLDEKIAALNRTIREANPPAGYRINGATATAEKNSSQPPAGKRQGERRPPKKVVLRAEKQEGRLQTFALVLVVIALLIYALYRFA